MPRRPRFSWKDILSTVVTFALVVIWNILFSYDSAKNQFPFLIRSQYRLHQLFYRMLPYQPSDMVTVVEIGDKEYWGKELAGRVPTKRDYLGTLICNAADAGAATVVLDFRLLSTGQAGTDSPEYQDEDNSLLQDINCVTKAGTPVVLAYGLVDTHQGKWMTEPGIFAHDDLPLCQPEGKTPEPGCVRFGHVNLPLDKRQVALQMEAIDSGENTAAQTHRRDSLALAAVVAYQAKENASKRVYDQPLISDCLNSDDFVYGRFRSPEEFSRVSAEHLYNNQLSGQERKSVSNRIVLIGAAWSKSQGELGGSIESFDSPVGDLPGVYFHANYIADLVETPGQYKPPVPTWLGVLIDFLVGVLAYFFYHMYKGRRKRQWAVIVLSTAVLITIYVLAFRIFDYYLDFVLPALLYSVHLVLLRLELV